MTDRQRGVFVWTLAVLTAVLVLVACGCGVSEARIKLLQSDVASIGSIAKENPYLTGWDRSRLDYHVDRVVRQLEELK